MRISQLNTRNEWQGPNLFIVSKCAVAREEESAIQGEGLHSAMLPHAHIGSRCGTCCALFHRLWNNILIINLM